jgi:vacuolar-type H+-ATPase subunit I/STV1
MEILQKQRLEFESLLARKLRDQEDALSRQANAELQHKDSTIQAVVQAAAEAQEAEHKADLESTEERLKSELNAKYEVEYAEKLAELKSGFVKELEEKVSAINDLANQLQHLESALQVSRSFETGSIRAHRMSAAALALSEKLETNKGAANELEALKVSRFAKIVHAIDAIMYTSLT